LPTFEFAKFRNRKNKTQQLRGFQRHLFFSDAKTELRVHKNVLQKHAEPRLNRTAKIFLFFQVEMAKLRSFFSRIFMPSKCRCKATDIKTNS